MADTREPASLATALHDRTLCPSCNTSNPRIAELEHEVIVLTQKSITAANKLASYEEEIRQLRLQRSTVSRSTSAADIGQHDTSIGVDARNGSPEAVARPATLARLASFTMGRKPSGPTANPLVDLGDLQNALARETAARVEAEKKSAQVNDELEDLSAQLFEQANEMVATERRARAKLEERVALLEQRDKDKIRRLERIEGAVKRLDRVKVLLGT